MITLNLMLYPETLNLFTVPYSSNLFIHSSVTEGYDLVILQ